MARRGRASALDDYIRRLRSTAWKRGFGGSRPWLAAGIGMSGARMLRRMLAEKPEVLYRHKLEPGERFEVVVSPPPPTKRQRKRAQRAERKAGDH